MKPLQCLGFAFCAGHYVKRYFIEHSVCAIIFVASVEDFITTPFQSQGLSAAKEDENIRCKRRI
jgi:hypothetical protein